MLDGNADLNALLEEWRTDANAAPYSVELYEITLSGGVVIRWSTGDKELSWDGQTWELGPGISRSQISRSIGTGASELELTLSYDDSVLMNDGVTLAAFISGGGFFFATVRLYRAYAPSPNYAIVGALPKFAGRITKLSGLGETQGTLTISDPRSLLNVQVPPAMWQPSCNHIVFDSGCKLDRADWQVTGLVTAGSTALTVHTDLSAPADYLDLGKVTFLTGINAGQSRAVRSHIGDGSLRLVRALPSVPNVGDQIIAYPGCNLTTAMCRDKFNNLMHRKGFEWIPVPETAAP